MILIDNVMYLKKRFPDVWTKLKLAEDDSSSELSIQVTEAKSGVQTLQALLNGISMYIHSKYNPVEEAEQFINQFKEVDKYQHVFFYGVGLGYHIDAFVQKYPNIKFTLYEPQASILKEFLSRKELKDYSANHLKTIFLENEANETASFLKQFVNNLNEELLMIQLPSYERLFSNKYQEFNTKFLGELKQKKLMFQVYEHYEKRWTINSMINLEVTLTTSNVILDKGEIFRNKPVILVAAGPSLQDEIENLKYIKEHGLAYIFSVGTSINALLSRGLEPDAACTYDPSPANAKVFESMKETGKTHIPLIFGSSVGYEVIKGYEGPKLHMLTNQDAVSSYYLKTNDNRPIDIIQDATSISVIALQLVNKLNCNPVILVGQNLAYRNNQVYASGASVLRASEVSNQDKVGIIAVESVDGELIESNRDFNLMRAQLEAFTSIFKGTEVINTTKGGARIANTTYVPLKEFMDLRLKTKVTSDDWFSFDKTCYNGEHATTQANHMKVEREQLQQYFDRLLKFFREINSAADRKNNKELVKLFLKFDKLFMNLLKNDFFVVFIKPMNRVYFDLLLQNVEKMRLENDSVAKARLIIQEFGKFIYGCQADAFNLDPLFQMIQKEVTTLLQKEE